MTLKDIVSKKEWSFIEKLPKEWQQLNEWSEVEQVSAEVKKTMRATVKNPWHIRGFEHAFSDLSFYVDFFSAGDETKLRLQGTLLVGKTQLVFLGEMIDEQTMSFSARDMTREFPTLFIPKKGALNQLARFRDFISLEDKNEIQFSLVHVNSGLQINSNLKIGLKEELRIAGTQICLKDPFLSISSFNNQENQDAQAVFSAAIVVTLHIGKPVLARVFLGADSIAILEIAGVDDDGLPGPSDLLKAIGFEEAGKTLEKTVKENRFLSSLYIDFVRIRFDLKTRKFASGDVQGHLRLSDHVVRFGVTFPRTILTASLDPETPILLAQLVKDTYPELQNLPTDLKVSRAKVQLMPDPLDFRFELRLSDVWKTKVGDMDLEFNQLDFRIHIGKDQPVTGGLTARLTLGGIDFGLLGERIASNKNTGWHFQTRIAQTTPVELKKIVNELTDAFGLPTADWLPNIELNRVYLDLNTLDKTFEIKANAEIKDKLGPFETISVDFQLKIDKSNKECPLSIKIDGDLKLEKSLIQFKSNLGNKNWFIEAVWEKEQGQKGLDFLDFVREVDREEKLDLSNVPTEIEKVLTLQRLSFSYHNETQSLDFSATNELGITLKFSLIKSGKVAAILGLKYDRKLNESEFGKSFKAFEKDMEFNNAWVILSWIPEGFKAPNKSSFDTGWPVALEKMGKGILLSADINIKEKATGAFKLLNDAVPNSPGSFQVLGQLNFSPFFVKMTLSYNKELTFETNGKYPLVIRNCEIGIELGTGKVGIEASGYLDFYVSDYKFESRLGLALSTAGIDVSTSTKLDKGIPLFGLRQVQLHQVDFELGIGFGPPSVKIGAGVEITFREDQGVKDYFGFLLAFSSPVPTPEYVGMDVTKISLNELIENLEANKAKKSYLPEKMAEIKAFSFVWALRDRTKLPDGTTVNSGVSFHGLLTLINWNAWFEFEAGPTIGVSGKGQFEKIDVEGFSVKGNTLDIKRLHYQQGAKWLPVSNAKRLLPGVKTDDRVMLSGGGALLQFSTYKSPYLFANFDIRILDIIRSKADIAITDKGMKCNVVVNIPNLYHLNHNAELREDKSFFSEGSFKAGLTVEVPFFLKPFTKGDLFVGIEGSQRISYGKDGSFYFYFGYKYGFLDIHIPGPSFEIPYAPKDFGQVLDIVWDNFRKNIFDNLFNIIVLGQYPAGTGQVIRTLDSTALRKRNMLTSEVEKQVLKSKVTWMEEALQDVDNERPMRKRSGAPSDRFKKLLSKAEEQTNTEISEMKDLLVIIEEGHEEVVDTGVQRLMREIASTEREIKDLRDEDHNLENEIRAIWNEHLLAYKTQKIASFDAENAFYHGEIGDKQRDEQQQKLDEIEWQMEAAVQKISQEYDPKRGYGNRKGKWVKLAVDHYFERVKLEADYEIEKDYVLLQKNGRNALIQLPNRTPKETIII